MRRALQRPVLAEAITVADVKSLRSRFGRDVDDDRLHAVDALRGELRNRPVRVNADGIYGAYHPAEDQQQRRDQRSHTAPRKNGIRPDRPFLAAAG